MSVSEDWMEIHPPEKQARLTRASQPCPTWEDGMHCWAINVHRSERGLREIKVCACGAELHRVKP